MPNPALIRQELRLRDQNGRMRKYDCVVDGSATVLQFLDAIAKKYGMHMEKQYYEKYGSYLITKIAGTDREGRRFELTDIQIYVDKSFVHLRAEDGTGVWANAELLRVRDLNGKEVTIQSDTNLGELLTQDLPKVPVLEREENIRNAIRNARSGGGASEPSAETSRKDLDNIRTQSTVAILVEPNSFRTTTMEGQEINDSNLLLFLNREFGLNTLPELAQQAIATQVMGAIEQTFIGQTTFDGSRAFEVDLRLVATRFDGVERYWMYAYPKGMPETDIRADNPDVASVSFEVQKTQMTPEQAHVKMERAVAELKRAGFTEKVAPGTVANGVNNPKLTAMIMPEESMITRLIMNPTERRLWGRLYGFPDEEIDQTRRVVNLFSEPQTNRKVVVGPTLTVREMPNAPRITNQNARELQIRSASSPVHVAEKPLIAITKPVTQSATVNQQYPPKTALTQRVNQHSRVPVRNSIAQKRKRPEETTERQKPAKNKKEKRLARLKENNDQPKKKKSAKEKTKMGMQEIKNAKSLVERIRDRREKVAAIDKTPATAVKKSTKVKDVTRITDKKLKELVTKATETSKREKTKRPKQERTESDMEKMLKKTRRKERVVEDATAKKPKVAAKNEQRAALETRERFEEPNGKPMRAAKELRPNNIMRSKRDNGFMARIPRHQSPMRKNKENNPTVYSPFERTTKTSLFRQVQTGFERKKRPNYIIFKQNSAQS